MAVVPQANNLPAAFTAWETVLLGRTPHLNWLGQTSPQDDERVRRAMQRTSTLEFTNRQIGELSGGEQQRVAIARALAQAAPLLLLDEPTAHLDLQYQVSLLDLVVDLAHRDGYAVLLVLHDLNLVSRYADRVALLVRGENGLKVIMMCEIPSNAILADRFLEYFDGFSIGSNDMTQLTLAVDRDSGGPIATTFDERDEAVKAMLGMAIAACRKAGKYAGICGRARPITPTLPSG
jgi:ABC-type hemin transport system ATPase subunit